jgi:hypothetical protein
VLGLSRMKKKKKRLKKIKNKEDTNLARFLEHGWKHEENH